MRYYEGKCIAPGALVCNSVFAEAKFLSVHLGGYPYEQFCSSAGRRLIAVSRQDMWFFIYATKSKIDSYNYDLLTLESTLIKHGFVPTPNIGGCILGLVKFTELLPHMSIDKNLSIPGTTQTLVVQYMAKLKKPIPIKLSENERITRWLILTEEVWDSIKNIGFMDTEIPLQITSMKGPPHPCVTCGQPCGQHK